MRPTKRDLRRIELKWECIRRNKEYQNDYAIKKRGTSRLRGLDFLRKWSLPFPVDPQRSFGDLPKTYGPRFLRDVMGFLIWADASGRTGYVSVESQELAWFIDPKRFEPYFSNDPLVWRKCAARQLLLKSISTEEWTARLQTCTITLNALAPSESLCDDFKKLVRAIQRQAKARGLLRKPGSFRVEEIPQYLAEYDRPPRRMKSTLRGERDDIEARKWRRYKQNAGVLINQGGWRLI